MRITYLFRSPGTGHSIEELFEAVQQEINQSADVQTRTVRLPYISKGLWQVWQNLRSLRGQSADVFHITGDVHYAALALPASRTVLTIHDCSLLKRNQQRPIRYVLFWLFWYYLPIRRAKRVTVVSVKTQAELIRYVGGIARKAVVIPNGYAPAFVDQPRSFQKAQPVLLQVGTAPNKNLLRLLAAIEGIHCSLILVGPLTEAICRELTQRRIEYLSYRNLSRDEVVQLYVNCDIVTFVSTYEGFGMPVLEANAVGRVMLTSDIAPLNTLAAEAAHLVDPTDANAIRRGILRLIQDDGYRQKLIDKGRQNAQSYTITKAAVHYAALYQECTRVAPFLNVVV